MQIDLKNGKLANNAPVTKLNIIPGDSKNSIKNWLNVLVGSRLSITTRKFTCLDNLSLEHYLQIYRKK